jgi:hypothetical protein
MQNYDARLDEGETYTVFISLVSASYVGFRPAGDFTEERGVGNSATKWISVGEGYDETDEEQVAFTMWGRLSYGLSNEMPVAINWDAESIRRFRERPFSSDETDGAHTPVLPSRQLVTPQQQELQRRQNLRQERICGRIQNRFSGNQSMIERVDRRIQKRFGFSCL